MKEPTTPVTATSANPVDESTASRIALLPCPFCGGKVNQFSGDAHFWVECCNAGCPIQPMTDSFPSVPWAIAAWNTRAASPVAGVSERIAEIEARLAAITPGPWDSLVSTVTSLGTGDLIATASYAPDRKSANTNARFIGAAPEDIAYLLKLVRAHPSAEGDGWVAVTPETMPPLDTWVWVCDGRRQVRHDKHSTGNPKEGWWYSFAGFVKYWKPIVLPAPPAQEGTE